MNLLGGAWSRLRVPPHHIARLTKKNLMNPTPVQSKVLDALMPQRKALPGAVDLSRRAVIEWPTGSGKTLAFVLPMLSRIDMQYVGLGCQAVIVSPTRELTLQTLHTVQQMAGMKPNKKGNQLNIVPVLGMRTPRLMNELKRRPPDIAIGTPQAVGRLLKEGALRLNRDPKNRTIILDEVGALLEDFRWPDVEAVLRGDGKLIRKDGAAGRATHPSPLDGNSERGKFAEGSIWLISAYVPMEAIQRCLRAADARSDGREITGHSSHGPPVTMLAPDGEASERRVPSSVRHVALRPIIPANPRKRRKRHPVGALLRSMLYGAGQGWRSGLHARGEAEEKRGLRAPPEELVDLEQSGGAVECASGEDHDVQNNNGQRGGLAGSARAVLVFVSSAQQAEELKKTMLNKRLRVAAIHSGDGRTFEHGGGVSGNHRSRKFALDGFKKGNIRVLVGTEMLAYGIDIQGASHVVNVDIPTSVSSYVHRAGRVGRVGGTRGVVVSLPRDETELNQLQSYADELGFTLEVMDKPPPPAPPVQPKHHLRRQMYHELRRLGLDSGVEHHSDGDDDDDDHAPAVDSESSLTLSR